MKNTLTKTILGLFMLLTITWWQSCKKKEDLAPTIEAKVTSYYPNSGKAGTLVTIEGEGLSTTIADYQVTVANIEAEVISATTESIIIRTPEGGASGSIVLKYADKIFEVGQYTYQDLTITEVFPANGTVGAQIQISGSGFGSTSEPVKVFINGKEALVVSVTDDQIVAEVPNEAGFGPVEVYLEGKSVRGQNFTYQAIHTIKPLSGGKGTRVVLSGVGFEEATAGNTVDFNGKEAVVLEASADRLVVLAPDAVSTGPVSVNINGQKTTGGTFTVVNFPVIEVVTPLSGPKDTEMVITGDLFSPVLDENKVFINDVEVPVLSATGKQLKLRLPGGTGSGKVRVVVNDQSTAGPLFKDQNLGIQSVSPDNGLAGTTITIKGTGFSETLLHNTVHFNGVLATVTAANETSLTVTAPQGLSTGMLKITVEGQEALAPKEFRRAGVMTLAGGPTSSHFGNNAGGLALDSRKNVYVTDRNNKVVKKITPEGHVSILQSNGVDIIFNMPSGIVVDKHDNIYVSDNGTMQIIKITSAGQRTVHSSGFSTQYITIDDAGNIFAAGGFGTGAYKVFVAGNYSNISGPSWMFGRPAVDAAGNLYYPDMNHTGLNGITFTPGAGGQTRPYFAGVYDAGYQDGIGSAARFSGITSVIFRGANELLVGDNYNLALRTVNVNSTQTSTVAKFTNGYADGTLTAAKFATISDVAVDSDGNIYVLDAINRAVRKIFLK